MATRVDGFTRRTRGRPPKYPWDKYVHGDPENDVEPGAYWHLVGGTTQDFKAGRVDFDVPATSFRALVHRTATARSDTERAETRIGEDGNSVTFRFVLRNPDGS